MKIYAIINDSSGGYAASYDGMTQEIINTMLTERGLTFSLVSQKEYQDFINSRVLPAPDIIREQAKVILKNPLSTTDQKVNALITILGV